MSADLCTGASDRFHGCRHSPRGYWAPDSELNNDVPQSGPSKGVDDPSPISRSASASHLPVLGVDDSVDIPTQSAFPSLESTPPPSRRPGTDRGGNVGRKKARRLNHETTAPEMSSKNAYSIAKSSKRRTDIIEEQTGMMAFKREDCETKEDLQNRADFLRRLRKSHLK